MLRKTIPEKRRKVKGCIMIDCLETLFESVHGMRREEEHAFLLILLSANLIINVSKCSDAIGT
jgi:hypothetical protein